jgi:hypothetical protein
VHATFSIKKRRKILFFSNGSPEVVEAKIGCFAAYPSTHLPLPDPGMGYPGLVVPM